MGLEDHLMELYGYVTGTPIEFGKTPIFKRLHLDESRIFTFLYGGVGMVGSVIGLMMPAYDYVVSSTDLNPLFQACIKKSVKRVILQLTKIPAAE